MKVSNFENPVRRSRGLLAQSIWDGQKATPHITEVRVWVEKNAIKVGIAGRAANDEKSAMKLLFVGSVGGDVIQLHRLMRLLELMEELSNDLFCKAVLAFHRTTPSIDNEKCHEKTDQDEMTRIILRDRFLNALRPKLSSKVIDEIKVSMPVNLVEELRFFRDECGVELNTKNITDAIETKIISWEEAFSEFEIETPEQRTERRRLDRESEEAARTEQTVDDEVEAAA